MTKVHWIKQRHPNGNLRGIFDLIFDKIDTNHSKSIGYVERSINPSTIMKSEPPSKFLINSKKPSLLC